MELFFMIRFIIKKVLEISLFIYYLILLSIQSLLYYTVILIIKYLKFQAWSTHNSFTKTAKIACILGFPSKVELKSTIPLIFLIF